MSGVAETSREAHSDLVASGKKIRQEQAVLDVIKANVGLSRRKIAEITGFEIGAVSGRVNNLVKNGKAWEMGTARDPKTGKTVKLVWADRDFIVEGPSVPF